MSIVTVPPPTVHQDHAPEPLPGIEAEAAAPSVARPRTWLAGVVVVALAALSTTAWWWLLRWYGLFQYRDHSHYSFERIEGGFNSPVMRETLAILLAIGGAYILAILLLQATGVQSRLLRFGVVALAIWPGIVNVLLYPVGALDVFNYMIELKLAFHYDENPYLVTFRAWEADSYARSAFLLDVTLFYGPAWLLATGVPAMLAGFHDWVRTLIALKVFNLLLIGLTALMVARYHRAPTTRWVAAGLVAANPLVLFEGVGNVHNDVLLMTFVIGAMLALQRRSPLAGPLLALSALVKLYTVALAPIFIVVALKEGWGWRRIAATVALTAVAVVATAGPYWSEGKLVDGLRAGLEESQEMDHVSPLSLFRQYEQVQEANARADTEFALSRPSFEIVPQHIQDDLVNGFTLIFVAGALLLAVAVWRGRSPALAAAETLLLLYLCMTNLYGWYLIPVIALLALHPDRLSRAYVMVATVLGLVYYPMFIYGHFTSGWSRFEIHQFLALFLTAPIVAYLLARAVTWPRVGRTAEVQPLA